MDLKYISLDTTSDVQLTESFDPLIAMCNNSNFRPLEVACRDSETQLPGGEMTYIR